MFFKAKGSGGVTGGMTVNNLWFVPSWATSDFVAVGAASAVFPSLGMLAGHVYMFTASTDCWIMQAASPTAAKSAGSLFVSKGTQVFVEGCYGANLAVLQDSVGGNASLVEVLI